MEPIDTLDSKGFDNIREADSWNLESYNKYPKPRSPWVKFPTCAFRNKVAKPAIGADGTSVAAWTQITRLLIQQRAGSTRYASFAWSLGSQRVRIDRATLRVRTLAAITRSLYQLHCPDRLLDKPPTRSFQDLIVIYGLFNLITASILCLSIHPSFLSFRSPRVRDFHSTSLRPVAVEGRAKFVRVIIDASRWTAHDLGASRIGRGLFFPPGLKWYLCTATWRATDVVAIDFGGIPSNGD